MMTKVDLEELGTHDFYEQVKQFNHMYKLGSAERPELPTYKVLENFYKIVKEELEEVFPLALTLNIMERDFPDGDYNEHEVVRILGELTDWVCDIIVYCNTFADRFGLPVKKGLDVIMQSNFSKLDEHGLPIYHPETGKVLKGPGYWKPEPALREVISEERSHSFDIDNDVWLQDKKPGDAG